MNLPDETTCLKGLKCAHNNLLRIDILIDIDSRGSNMKKLKYNIACIDYSDYKAPVFIYFISSFINGKMRCQQRAQAYVPLQGNSSLVQSASRPRDSIRRNSPGIVLQAENTLFVGNASAQTILPTH